VRPAQKWQRSAGGTQRICAAASAPALWQRIGRDTHSLAAEHPVELGPSSQQICPKSPQSSAQICTGAHREREGETRAHPVGMSAECVICRSLIVSLVSIWAAAIHVLIDVPAPNWKRPHAPSSRDRSPAVLDKRQPGSFFAPPGSPTSRPASRHAPLIESLSPRLEPTA